MIDLTDIIAAVITLICAVLTYKVIPIIKIRVNEEQLANMMLWVKIAVSAAEQIFQGSGRGAEKKAYVKSFLNKKGFDVDLQAVDALIESAVHALKSE